MTGLIFGAAPAWFATRTDPAEALRGSGRGTTDRSSFASRALLIVQATLSVVLVAGATMLGDGRVALILDVPGILTRFKEMRRDTAQQAA